MKIDNQLSRQIQAAKEEDLPAGFSLSDEENMKIALFLAHLLLRAGESPEEIVDLIRTRWDYDEANVLSIVNALIDSQDVSVGGFDARLQSTLKALKREMKSDQLLGCVRYVKVEQEDMEPVTISSTGLLLWLLAFGGIFLLFAVFVWHEFFQR